MSIRSGRNQLQLAFLGSLAAGLLVSCSWFGTQKPSTPTTGKPASPPALQTSSPAQPTAANPSQQPSASTQPAPKDQAQSPPSERTTVVDKDLVSQVQREVNNKGTIAKQDAGQTHMGNILQSQQATQLVKGRFTSSFEELNLNLPTETQEYRLQILTADQQRAVVVAIAKQPGIFSYTGAVYARQAKLSVASICKSNEPSRIPPTTPKLVKDGIVCPAGSTAVD